MNCFAGKLFGLHFGSGLLVMLLCTLAACSSPEQRPGTPSPHLVEVVRPSGGATAEQVEAVGTVQRRQEITLAFRLAGVVSRVRGEEGDWIRRGQIVAAIDPASFDAALVRTNAELDRARRNAERSEQLHAQGFVSTQRLQDDRTALLGARAAQRAAAFDRRSATLVAPVSGYVLERAVEVDEVVQAGQPVLRLADAGSALIVRAAMSDRMLAGLRAGSIAQVDDGVSGGSVAGRVSRIGARADAATGSVYVEIELPTQASFRSGQVVRVRFRRSGNDGFQRIPALALREARGDEATVMLYDSRRKVALKRVVRFGGLRDEFALVAGLAEDAAVITSGGAGLVDGQPVRVVAEAGVSD